MVEELSGVISGKDLTALDYVEYLSQRYKKKIKVKKNIEENPFLELSGFVEIGNMTSLDW